MTYKVKAKPPAAYCYQPLSNYIDMVLTRTKCQKKEIQATLIGSLSSGNTTRPTKCAESSY